MKALLLALALLMSASLGLSEQFTTNNAVYQYDSDGAYQIIFWNPAFTDFLTMQEGIAMIGSVGKNKQPVPVPTLPASETHETANSFPF